MKAILCLTTNSCVTRCVIKLCSATAGHSTGALSQLSSSGERLLATKETLQRRGSRDSKNPPALASCQNSGCSQPSCNRRCLEGDERVCPHLTPRPTDPGDGCKRSCSVAARSPSLAPWKGGVKCWHHWNLDTSQSEHQGVGLSLKLCCVSLYNPCAASFSCDPVQSSSTWCQTPFLTAVYIQPLFWDKDSSTSWTLQVGSRLEHSPWPLPGTKHSQWPLHSETRRCPGLYSSALRDSAPRWHKLHCHWPGVSLSPTICSNPKQLLWSAHSTQDPEGKNMRKRAGWVLAHWSESLYKINSNLSLTSGQGFTALWLLTAPVGWMTHKQSEKLLRGDRDPAGERLGWVLQVWHLLVQIPTSTRNTSQTLEACSDKWLSICFRGDWEGQSAVMTPALNLKEELCRGRGMIRDWTPGSEHKVPCGYLLNFRALGTVVSEPPHYGQRLSYRLFRGRITASLSPYENGTNPFTSQQLCGFPIRSLLRH